MESIDRRAGRGRAFGNVDALTIVVSGAASTYDFELEPPSPQTTDNCKDGGWEDSR